MVSFLDRSALCGGVVVMAALTGCGGGGGGNDTPGGPATDPVDVTVPGNSGDNTSTTDKSLVARGDRERLAAGFIMGTWFGNTFLDIHNAAIAAATDPATTTTPCSAGGELAKDWVDNDGDGVVSLRDQFKFVYRSCDNGESVREGEITATRLSDTKFDYAADFSDGPVGFAGALTGQSSVLGGGIFSNSGVTFPSATNTISYDGLKLAVETLRFTHRIASISNSYELEFRLFVRDANALSLASGVEFATTNSYPLRGVVGQLPSSGKWHENLSANFYKSVEITVAPDPAYVILRVAPGFMSGQTPTITTLSWIDFLK